MCTCDHANYRSREGSNCEKAFGDRTESWPLVRPNRVKAHGPFGYRTYRAKSARLIEGTLGKVVFELFKFTYEGIA